MNSNERETYKAASKPANVLSPTDDEREDRANVKNVLPGTWFVTVTRADKTVVRTIMTFTADEGMVERAEPEVEAAVGVWKKGDKNDGFRFMFYRFVEHLTVTKEVVTATFSEIQRLRSTNHFTSAHTFTGTGTLDFLDAAGNLLPGSPVFHTTHEGIRLLLARE